MTKYRVYCEDCDFERTYGDDSPPSHVPEDETWDAESAALGKRDNHRMSAFRDYDAGKRHRPHIEEV